MEAAYRCGNPFEQRRHLIEAFSEYCSRPHVEGHVVPLRKEFRHRGGVGRRAAVEDTPTLITRTDETCSNGYRST